MADIKNTGERILPDVESPLMIARHFCAYEFTKSFVTSKAVLDIGCGEGYGIDFLAENAKEAVGLDYDDSVIIFATGKYRKKNLKFTLMDVRNLKSINRKFDVICSFQNIEHISHPDELLADVVSLLEAGGVFVCSTCNKHDASPGRDKPFNKFHVKEYDHGEFKSLLSLHFDSVELFGLQRGLNLKLFRRMKKIGIFNFFPERLNPVTHFYKNITCKDFFWTKEGVDKALDFIAICRNKPFDNKL